MNVTECIVCPNYMDQFKEDIQGFEAHRNVKVTPLRNGEALFIDGQNALVRI